MAINLANGYVLINRTWNKGDVISLQIPMDVRMVMSDEKVKADKNKIAIERGPIVYCAEWPYVADGKVLSLIYNKTAEFKPEFDNALLNGIEKITTKARLAKRTLDNAIQFSEEQNITLIPYYAWNNKGAGEMEVWLPISESSVRPLPAPTIAGKSKVSASIQSKAIIALNDQYEPLSSNDHTWLYFHWWPKNDSWEWVQYDFEERATVSSSKVYWFDDGPFGGCRIPDAWDIQYKSGNEWIDVKNSSPYKVTKDAWDEIKFEPVVTSALRLRVKLNKVFSSGIHEWEVR
jgi:uncharacterized protein